MSDALICQKCKRPVAVEAERFNTFEKMHYVCFHYEFEHGPTDPDEEYSVGGCPSAAVHPRQDRRPPTGASGPVG